MHLERDLFGRTPNYDWLRALHVEDSRPAGRGALAGPVVAGDEPGTMPGTEYLAVAGSGSQVFNERWGDYSTMDVDPVDDCTFWYTHEYYEHPPSEAGWLTRIISFRLPGCE